jgi:hypothetical protein
MQLGNFLTMPVVRLSNNTLVLVDQYNRIDAYYPTP